MKEIYRALGNAFGINILFDQAVKDDRITIELRDVTAQQALERSNEELRQFAFVASHDLKGPLRSIGGFAQLVEREGPGEILHELAVLGFVGGLDELAPQRPTHRDPLRDLGQRVPAAARVPVTGQGATSGNSLNYTLVVPAGATAFAGGGPRPEAPAGSGLAARLASVGFDVIVGSRSKYRAMEIRARDLPSSTPTPAS